MPIYFTAMRSFFEPAQELQSVLGLMIGYGEADIRKASEWICETAVRKRTIFTCGNGGSAATALHMTEELVGRFTNERRPVSSICLSADSVAMSCIANDFGWSEVFSRQLAAQARRGDLLVSFSTSGNSTNVVNAVREALRIGLYCIHLGGDTPGVAGGAADVSIRVPTGSTARVQEVHTLLLHHFLACVEDSIENT